MERCSPAQLQVNLPFTKVDERPSRLFDDTKCSSKYTHIQNWLLSPLPHGWASWDLMCWCHWPPKWHLLQPSGILLQRASKSRRRCAWHTETNIGCRIVVHDIWTKHLMWLLLASRARLAVLSRSVIVKRSAKCVPWTTGST